MQVRIEKDVNGNALMQSSNPEYAYIRVTQKRITIQKSFIRPLNLSALIHGKIQDFEDVGINSLETLPGKIVIKESLVPFNNQDPERDLKIAGDTGIVCTYFDQPIYRVTLFTSDLEDPDVFIQHTNTEEIKAAMEAAKPFEVANSVVPTVEATVEPASKVDKEFFASKDPDVDAAEEILQERKEEEEEEEVSFEDFDFSL